MKVWKWTTERSLQGFDGPIRVSIAVHKEQFKKSLRNDLHSSPHFTRSLCPRSSADIFMSHPGILWWPAASSLHLSLRLALQVLVSHPPDDYSNIQCDYVNSLLSSRVFHSPLPGMECMLLNRHEIICNFAFWHHCTACNSPNLLGVSIPLYLCSSTEFSEVESFLPCPFSSAIS